MNNLTTMKRNGLLSSIPQGKCKAQTASLMNFTNHLRNKSNLIQTLAPKSVPTHLQGKQNLTPNLHIHYKRDYYMTILLINRHKSPRNQQTKNSDY